MDLQFEALAESMEGEVVRQFRRLELCRAQYGAIRANDLEYVEAKAADIDALNCESMAAQTRRDALIVALAERCGLTKIQDVFQELILAAPEPCRSRLCASESRVQAVQHEIRNVVMGGIGCLQNAANTIVQAMEAFKGCVQLVPETAAPAAATTAASEARSLAA